MQDRPENTQRLSRRLLLQGTGVSMALPWLESVAVWGDENASASSALPQRIAVMFMANGVAYNHWWAKGQGSEMELGDCLMPLDPFKEKLNFIKGLYNPAAVGVGIHPGQTGNLLSGAKLKKGAELRGGVSMDQMLAKHVGAETLQPSLVLGCEQPTTGYHETNFSMAYSSHISWHDATSPVPMETYPALAFDSLFENRGAMRNRSVLDRVREHAASLQRQVSHSDQAKLDEYMTSVREIEKRIERMRKLSEKAEANARDKDLSATKMSRPDAGLPEDIREHMRLMCDIIATAFQTDKTRVATLLLCRDISGLIYPFLDVRLAHHLASHRDTTDDYLRICRYYIEQVAYLAGKLEKMHEGDSTVLDNSMLMFMSNMWSGKNHDSSKVPLIQVGGLAGTVETGRVLDYSENSDDERKLCNLYLSLMDRMGVQVDEFGDSTQQLAGF
ncbi:DUF1552 domain-containing protein [Stieleria sp. JC731]|uniref:DUF1552 domain-containing protein n=1 Tax=Pirellulaceae TaxID=2691357 RepID=UPI001E2C776D|nr:DUF1552 domain-containing protein [Stieleria sp. JC731]MCC9602214.1 DUF1552 domain-containing protein [Stieleria sp. JC731]